MGGASRHESTPNGLSEPQKMMAMVYGAAEGKEFQEAHLRFIQEVKHLALFRHMKPFILECHKGSLHLMELVDGEYSQEPRFPDFTKEMAVELVERTRVAILSDLIKAHQ